MQAVPSSIPPIDPGASIPARMAQLAQWQARQTVLAGSGRPWTRAHLHDEATRIARALLRHGDPGKPVALLLSHDAPLIAAVLGTLYAGRIFAVLDPGFPAARNRSILENLDAGIVLADRAHAVEAAKLAGPTRRLMIDEAIGPLPATPLPGMTAAPDTPLGIFHTTGTTGRPKGVLWNQSITIGRAMTDRDDVGLCPTDRFALLTAMCFPAAISDTFNALMNGASLHLYDARNFGVTWLAQWLRQERISCLRSPVALFRHLVSTAGPDATLPDLRSVALSGDALNRSDVIAARRILAPHCHIVHRYSMSETGMLARDLLQHDSPLDDEVVPAGFIAPGKTVRILDDAGEVASPGVVGEIAIGDEGLAAGYWQDGALQPLPSVPDPLRPGRRLYRCGDFGRVRSDGRLELAGRQDHRVKIRGYRVELPVVEAALRALPCLREGAVAVHPDASGEKSLVGFVVPSAGVVEAGIRQALAERLPDYMVPTSFVLLDALPLAANGKLDRAALRLPEQAPAVQYHDAGSDEFTTGIHRIFAEVLRRENFGPEDDFFALGGHSLLAARVLARVAAVFDRKLPLSAFYAAPTVSGLAAALRDESEDAALSAEVLDQVRLRALHDLGWA